MKILEQWPCNHICKVLNFSNSDLNYWSHAENYSEIMNAKSRMPVPDYVQHCPACGAFRPKEKHWLDQLFDKHAHQYNSNTEWRKAIIRDLKETFKMKINASEFNYEVVNKIIRVLDI